MSRRGAQGPRPTDVAQWVATLAAPMPDPLLRAAYRDAIGKQGRARGQLRAWGLDAHGAPIPSTPTSTPAR